MLILESLMEAGNFARFKVAYSSDLLSDLVNRSDRASGYLYHRTRTVKCPVATHSIIRT